MRNTSIILLLVLGMAAWAGAQQPLPYSQLDPKQYNPATDPDIDMFIGYCMESMPRNIYGSLVVRDILTKLEGEPLRPVRKGACLTHLTSVSLATLEPHARTTPAKLSGEQELYYVQSGAGRVTSGGTTADLREGIGLIVPPDVEFTFENTGEGYLTMYRIVEPIPAGFAPKKEVVVTDEYAHSQAMTVHWANIDRGIMSSRDGTAVVGGLTAVKLDPMTMAQPHSHPEGVEEVWVALKGDITVLLGKQLRKLPVGAAYRIPSDGITSHANINVTDKQIKLMHMMHVPKR